MNGILMNTLISDNGVSKIWLGFDGLIYKQQPKFMTDNEIWCLRQLWPTGYVPFATQFDVELIKMGRIEPTPITDFDELWSHFERVLRHLVYHEIRHGDLTEKNMIIRYNKPYVIDFSESRLFCDPRVDKRPQGDAYWIKKTFEKLKNEHLQHSFS